MPSWPSKKLRSLTTQSENLHIQCHEKVFSSFQIIKQIFILDNKNLNKYEMQFRKTALMVATKVAFDHQLKKKNMYCL